MSSAVSRLGTNTFFLYLLTFSRYFIGLLLLPYMSRVLSVEGFGLIGFAMAYVLLFQVIVEFGFMISETATISKKRTDVKAVTEIVSAAMWAKLGLMLVSVLLFAISAVFLPMVRDNLLVVSLFLISAFLAAMVPDYFFRGIEKMKAIAVRTVIVRALTLLLVVILVKDESQIILIPIAFIVGNLLAFVVSLILMGRMGVAIKLVGFGKILQVIRKSAMFFLSRVSVSISQSSGSFLVGLNYSPASVESGVFAGATRISLASEMMLSPVSDSLYPHMVNKKDYKLLKKVVVVGGILWFIGCSGVFIFANDVSRVVLGPEYTSAGDLLRVLLFGNFIAFFSNMFGYNSLVPIGKATHANIAIAAGAIFNLLACGILWFTQSISIISVCVVIAATNLVVFVYRASVLVLNRNLIQQSSDGE